MLQNIEEKTFHEGHFFLVNKGYYNLKKMWSSKISVDIFCGNTSGTKILHVSLIALNCTWYTTNDLKISE